MKKVKSIISFCCATLLFSSSFGMNTVESADQNQQSVQTVVVDDASKQQSVSKFVESASIATTANALKSHFGWNDDSAAKSAQYTSIAGETLDISQGAIVNFASNKLEIAIASSIKGAGVANPYNITHNGIVLVANPKDVYNVVIGAGGTSNIVSSGISNSITSVTSNSTISAIGGILGSVLNATAQNAIANELLTYHRDVIAGTSDAITNDMYRLFCIETKGSVAGLITNVSPYVHIRDFNACVNEYEGSVYFRNLNQNIPYSHVMAFLYTHLGRPYEEPANLRNIAVGTQQNDDDLFENIFSGELAAGFYKEMGILPTTVNPDDVLPANFSYFARPNDLLSKFADAEISLKQMEQESIACSCLDLLKQLIKRN